MNLTARANREDLRVSLKKNKILNWIEMADVKSDDFFEVYTAIWEKYFTYPDPDDYQQAAQLLAMVLNKSCGDGEMEKVVMSTAKIVNEVFNVFREGKGGAARGEIGFKDQSIFFTLSTSPDELAKFEKMIRNAVMVKANEQGIGR